VGPGQLDAAPDGQARDESGRQWDERGEAGLAFAKGIKSVEYYRDVRPVLERSCVACHTAKGGEPAGNLDLDAPDETYQGRRFPGAYYRLHEANQGAWTAHTLVFEPGPLKLHVAFGDGKRSATDFPLKRIDLSQLLKPGPPGRRSGTRRGPGQSRGRLRWAPGPR
jgi:hypothetical protein